MQQQVVVTLPLELWRVIVTHIAFDDRLTLLRLLSVNKAMFELAQPQLWRFLGHLAQALPLHRPVMCVTHDGRGGNMRVSMVGDERRDGQLYLPRLIKNIAQDTEAYFTRETMSFLLAVALHEPMRGHAVQYERYHAITSRCQLRELYRFQPRDQSLRSLDKDPAVQVYTLPDDVTLPPLTEVERLALAFCEGCDKRYAVFYEIARQHLVLRDPLPGDPLYRVVLNGEHIFSEARATELGALFWYRAKQGAELVRVMDIVALNVEHARKHTVRALNGRGDDDISLSEGEVYHEDYQEDLQRHGNLFDGLFGSTAATVPIAARDPEVLSISDDDDEDEDDDTTIDSGMLSDETIDPYTDDTVSCDIGSVSTPSERETEESVSATLGSADDEEDEDDDDEDEDDNYALDSDTDDEPGSSSNSSGEEDDAEQSRQIIDCT